MKTARTARRIGPCPTPYKHDYASIHWATIGAKQTARDMVAAGDHFPPMYVYQCECGVYHLTHRESFHDAVNELVWQVPDALQEWAKRPATPRAARPDA